MQEDVSRTTLDRDRILLTGRAAVVTGGGAGIGRGIAIGLAEFGADVAILEVDAQAAAHVAELVRAKGRRAEVLAVDVNDRDGARAALAKAADAFGRLDILVNNVGGVRPTPLLQLTDRQIDRHLDLNLKSVVTMTQAAARIMSEARRGGAIVNIASIEATRAAPTYSVYAAGKAGVLNFTRTAAVELAEHGIRVNAIAPDIVPTEHLVRFAPAMLAREHKAAQARYIPMGRTGNFDDCASAAVFLCSDMAAYVTGVTLHVDGDTWASSGWSRTGEGQWRLYE